MIIKVVIMGVLMSKSAKILVGIIVVAAIAVVVILMTNKSDDKSSNKTTTTEQSHSSSDSNSTNTSDQKVAATITYDGNGFSPDTTTVKAGETVKIVNSSSNAALDFDSDPHPTHTNNPDLNAGDVEPGQSKTFSTDRTGTWGFHNHDDPSQHGNLIVK